MIPFFKKLRKRFADDNKPMKYTRYAIGEIVLVVIGILIALQINNWNENHKLKLFEHKMLKELKVALEMDLSDIEENIFFNSAGLKSQKIIGDWLDSDLPYSDSLCFHFSNATIFSKFLSDKSVFETLKVNGMTIISNDSLRNKISRLYGYGYSLYNLRENSYNTWIEKMRFDINIKYFNDSDTDEKNPPLFNSCMHLVDPIVLKKSTEYAYVLKSALAENPNVINVMVETQNNILNIISLIDIELEL